MTGTGYTFDMGDVTRIVRDPAICGGAPVFRGTRVTLRTVLATLAAGAGRDDVLRTFPTLAPEDVDAAISFAAAAAVEDLPAPRLPDLP